MPSSEVVGAAVGVLVMLATLKRVFSWFYVTDANSKRDTSGEFLEDPSSLDRVPCPSLWEDATKDLSLIMPAYNEEERMASTLDETLRYLRQRQARAGGAVGFSYEVVVVDDGSRDGTSGVAFDYVRKHGMDTVRCLRLQVNVGKGGAVKRGMLIARGRRILMLDADGATNIQDCDALERALPGGAGCDGTSPAMAVGSRAHLLQKAVAKRKWYRNILMYGFHTLVLAVIGGAIKDTQCGFKIFTRAAARKIIPNQRLSRWCFDVEWLYLAQQLGIPVKEVAVNWTEIPGSKLRVYSVVSMAFELMSINVGYKILQSWTIKT